MEEFESEIKQLKEDGNDTTANITEHNTDFEGTYAALCRGEKLVVSGYCLYSICAFKKLAQNNVCYGGPS